MPVGIPKVPFLVPEEDDASWVELYNRLYHERLLFLGQEINSEVSNHLVGLIIYLGIEDRTKDIFLFINSPGGGVISGMAIYDAMHFVKAEVQTVCVGIAASMASVILAGGTITKRLAFPHARVMIHQPFSSLAEGRSVENLMDAKELEIIRDSIVKIYVKRTGRSPDQIDFDMMRDSFMSAEEARAYGIIDMIAAGD